ncbi:MAG: DNA repair protein RadC [Deltaproteobacteria bacterium]|nr:DNA repair protein RadC [Deltaproteobacteria bacterium]
MFSKKTASLGIVAASKTAAPTHCDLPRQRLLRLGPRALSDAELLALLFRTGSGEIDALDLARQVLSDLGGMGSLAKMAGRELLSIRGVGPAKSASLLAALELGRRLAARTLHPGDPVRGPADVARHFFPRLRHAPQESFYILLLDGRHRVLSERLVSRGTLTASLVHPREVFRPAVRDASAAMILVHNHPSGDPTPSPEDREVTKRLERAGELMGIPVLDHVVVAEQGFVSLRELGILPAAASERRTGSYGGRSS